MSDAPIKFLKKNDKDSPRPNLVLGLGGVQGISGKMLLLKIELYILLFISNIHKQV